MSWDMVKLGDICSTITKGTTPTTLGYSYAAQGVPFLRAQNLCDDRVSIEVDPLYISVETHSNLARSTIYSGDVLLAIAGTIGRSALVQDSIKEANCNQAVAIVRANKIILPKYLLLNFKTESVIRQITGSKVTATISNLSLGQIKKLKIPLPPLETQKRIVELLDRAQVLIDKRNEQIKLMDDLIQSLFYDMFGDPVTNPMGWEETPLVEVADIKSGVTKGRKFGGKETVLVPYMRVANVQDERLALEDVAEIEVLPTDIEKYLLKNNDILVTEGGDPDKLGRGAIWKCEIEPCIHQNHIFRIRLKGKQLTHQYVSKIISSQKGKRYFLKAAKQTTGIASINIGQLKKCPILFPPIALQNTFAKRVEKIEAQKQAMTSSLKELEDNFASLMQRAFKGELDRS